VEIGLEQVADRFVDEDARVAGISPAGASRASRSRTASAADSRPIVRGARSSAKYSSPTRPPPP